MANFNLFDRAGRFTEPNPETLAALTEGERVAIARIRDMSKLLDQANLAAQENADKLAEIRVEIEALEKSVPKITFNDLAKAQARDTQRRKMGL